MTRPLLTTATWNHHLEPWHDYYDKDRIDAMQHLGCVPVRYHAA